MRLDNITFVAFVVDVDVEADYNVLRTSNMPFFSTICRAVANAIVNYLVTVYYCLSKHMN